MFSLFQARLEALGGFGVAVLLRRVVANSRWMWGEAGIGDCVAVRALVPGRAAELDVELLGVVLRAIGPHIDPSMSLGAGGKCEEGLSSMSPPSTMCVLCVARERDLALRLEVTHPCSLADSRVPSDHGLMFWG